MRNAAVREIINLAQKDADVVLLTGDLGYGVLEEFRERYPDRFFNAGICEQAMASVAAGLALEGKKVFLYSIGNFPTLRCVEQIRNDICGHQADVTILAVGGGFAYAGLGMSHHATEDIAIMRSLPQMKVLVPADREEARAAVRAAFYKRGPCYIRLNKGGECPVHQRPLHQFQIGKALQIREGDDACIFAAGAVVSEVVQAAECLAAEGIQTCLYSFCSIKPLDQEVTVACAKRFSVIVTVEEHNRIGGLGSAVSEIIAECGTGTRIVRLGVDDVYMKMAGSQAYLRGCCGIDSRSVAAAVREAG